MFSSALTIMSFQVKNNDDFLNPNNNDINREIITEYLLSTNWSYIVFCFETGDLTKFIIVHTCNLQTLIQKC